MLVADRHLTDTMRWVPSGIRVALILSLLAHLLLLLLAEVGGQLGWWQHRFIQNWLVTPISARRADALAQAKKQAEARKTAETPLVFLDVDPTQASTDAPENPAYYAALNSRAANPDTSQDNTAPRIDGQQDHVPRTTTVTRPSLVDPQPMEPVPPTPRLAALQPKTDPPALPRQDIQTDSQTALQPGDLLVAKPAPDSQNASGRDDRISTPQNSPPQERPRTFAQVRTQKGETPLVGEKMKQQGGVRRFGVESTLDARATSYGAYDAAVILAIQQRWYSLLDQRGYSYERTGKVVVTFRMKYDGTIQDLHVEDSDVGDLLSVVCQKAISDPAPFGAWPRQMRIELGDYRNVRFTFHYH